MPAVNETRLRAADRVMGQGLWDRAVNKPHAPTQRELTRAVLAAAEGGPMDGLLVVGTTMLGGFLGGCGGMFAAMLWADMDLASADGPVMVLGGVVVGALAGAYVGGRVIG
jgi:hypothetical protein